MLVSCKYGSNASPRYRILFIISKDMLPLDLNIGCFYITSKDMSSLDLNVGWLSVRIHH